MAKKQTALGINPKNFIPYNVMVVGSSKGAKEHLLRILVRKEFSIVSSVNLAKNAFEELQELESSSRMADLIFVDVEKPDPSTMVSLRKIRDKFPDLKIIILGNHSEKNLVQELVKLKVNAFVLKPLDDSTLTEKLANLLGRKDMLPKQEIVVYETKQIDLKNLNIPSIPEVQLKVLRVNTDDPEIGCTELEKIIKPDKSIASSVIRVANSSFYGRSGSISTLKDAITLLGVNTVKNLVFLQGKKAIYGSIKDKGYKKFLTELPILSALVAFDLSNVLKLKQKGEHLFLYSLLGRIGMIVMALNFPKKYKEALRYYEFGVSSLIKAENEIFTTDSSALSLKVFNLWKMPEDFQQSLKNQNFTLEQIEQVTPLDRALRISEMFAMRLVGIELTEEDILLLSKILELFQKPDLDQMFAADYYELIQDHPLYAMAMSG